MDLHLLIYIYQKVSKSFKWSLVVIFEVKYCSNFTVFSNFIHLLKN